MIYGSRPPVEEWTSGGVPSDGSLLLDLDDNSSTDQISENQVPAPLRDTATSQQTLSTLSRLRSRTPPTLPLIFHGQVTLRTEKSVDIPPAVKKFFPFLHPQGSAHIFRVIQEQCTDAVVDRQPIRVGVAFAGSQGSGGHNVIAGLRDYLQFRNEGSQVFAFHKGFQGIKEQSYLEVTAEQLAPVRNNGSFFALTAGPRVALSTKENLEAALRVAHKLDLHGLLLIGGDMAGSDAAVAAEYFAQHKCETAVIAVPKASSGDLCNDYVEVPLGFDSAVRCFAEFVGNLETDVATSGKYYHFVRLLGTRSSHVAIQVAKLTRPNYTAVGEYLASQNVPFTRLIDVLEDLLMRRAKLGKTWGVILLPEGLLASFPEMTVLWKELRQLGCSRKTDPAEVNDRLSPPSQTVWKSLPRASQLLCLAQKQQATQMHVHCFPVEKLVAQMLQHRSEASGWAKGLFNPRCHVMAREGRAAFPSPFDSSYSYTLGATAAALVERKVSGCMAVVKRLHLSPEGWACYGIPLSIMCSAAAPRESDSQAQSGCKATVVMSRSTVDTASADFDLFLQAQSVWGCRDCYVSPGPIQFDGPTGDPGPVVLKLYALEDLVPDRGFNWVFRERRHYFPRSDEQFSPLQRHRLSARIPRPALLRSRQPAIHSFFAETRRIAFVDAQAQSCVSSAYALQCRTHGSMILDLCESREPERTGVAVTSASRHSSCEENAFGTAEHLEIMDRFQCEKQTTSQSAVETNGGSTGGFTAASELRVGVLLNGQQAAGVANVLVGLWDRLSMACPRGVLLGFVGGVQGLLQEPARVIELTRDDIALCRNQGGFEVLGRQKEAELLLATDAGVEKAVKVVNELSLDALLLIGGRHTITCAAVLTEVFLLRRITTVVITVPATQNNNLNTALLESCLGFDSSSKCYSQLIGNLNADSANGAKYWNFIRLMGVDKSHIALEAALATHSTVTLVSEYFSTGSSLEEVIKLLADAVVTRQQLGKNYGTALIPEGLITSLPEFALLLVELRRILTTFSGDSEQFDRIARELVELAPDGIAREQCSPFSWALLGTLPSFIRAQLVQPKALGCLELTKVATEELISELVERELQNRVAQGLILPSSVGLFKPLCFYFGYQCRGTLPSLLDSALGWAHGALAAELARAGRTGYVTALRGLAAKPREWICRAYPCTAFLRPRSYVMEHDILPRPMPAVPGEMVDLSSDGMKFFLLHSPLWLRHDLYRNSGPLQFDNEAAREPNNLLVHDHQKYLDMLKRVNRCLSYIRRIGGSGASEAVLHVTVGVLSTIHEIIERMPPANV